MKNTKMRISGDNTTVVQYSSPATGSRLQRAAMECPLSASAAMSPPNTTPKVTETVSSARRRVMTTPPTMITA